MNLKIVTHIKYTMVKGTNENQGKISFRRVVMNNCVRI